MQNSNAKLVHVGEHLNTDFAKYFNRTPNIYHAQDTHDYQMISTGFRISKTNFEKLNELVNINADLNTNRSEIVNAILEVTLPALLQSQTGAVRKPILELRKRKIEAEKKRHAEKNNET